MPHWKITSYDSLDERETWTLPGTMSEQQVEVVLQRLVCSSLNQNEIMTSSFPVDSPRRTIHLDRVGSGRPMSFGCNPHFTARKDHSGDAEDYLHQRREPLSHPDDRIEPETTEPSQ